MVVRFWQLFVCLAQFPQVLLRCELVSIRGAYAVECKSYVQ
jgi:hypothetical protein